MPKLDPSRLTRPAHTKVSAFDQARQASARYCEDFNRRHPYGSECVYNGAVTRTRSIARIEITAPVVWLEVSEFPVDCRKLIFPGSERRDAVIYLEHEVIPSEPMALR